MNPVSSYSPNIHTRMNDQRSGAFKIVPQDAIEVLKSCGEVGIHRDLTSGSNDAWLTSMDVDRLENFRQSLIQGAKEQAMRVSSKAPEGSPVTPPELLHQVLKAITGQADQHIVTVPDSSVIALGQTIEGSNKIQIMKYFSEPQKLFAYINTQIQGLACEDVNPLWRNKQHGLKLAGNTHKAALQAIFNS